MTDALFALDGDGFLPTELSQGPWDPNALHGGAPAALMARAIESVDPGAGMFVTRMTVEFLRPVPRAHLVVSTTLVRPGKKVQLVDASIEAGGVEVARATALRIRQAPMELPDYPRPEEETPAFPDEVIDISGGIRSGMGSAMEIRTVRGHFATPGPAAAWMRLRYPVVEGEQPSPLMRVMGAADFGNGLSGVLDYFKYIYINPDLTVYLHRHPVGEWVCLDAATEASPNGVGVAESRLWDCDGPIGRSLQALLIDQRPT
jgi:hypothetical protein